MSNPYRLNLSKFSTHNIVKELIGDNGLVLDVGCNDGYLGMVSGKSNKFYGIDLSKEVISKAKKHYERVSVYDLNHLEKLPWEEKFDVIVFADVLEHVLFPDKVLKYFTRNYLNKNGKIIISLPNIANWEVRLNLLLGNFDYTDAGILDRTHLHFYTFKSAKELVNGINLKITDEGSGSSLFGYLITTFPFLKNFLATSIVIKAERK